jgi:two-component system, NtrC family, sensor kinase
MSIRTKVIGCFLAILFLFLGVSVYNYCRLRRTNERLTLVNELFLPLSRLVVQLQGEVHSHSEEVHRFNFERNVPMENSTFSRMVRDLYPYLIQKRFSEVEHLLEKPFNVENQVFITELRTMLNTAFSNFEKLSSTTDSNQFDQSYAELRSQLRALSKKTDDECQKITLEAQQEGRESLFLSVFLSVLVSLLGVLSAALSHRVLKPLPALIDSLNKIADGDFHRTLKVNASATDEITLLAREYNRMLAALCERDRKIQLQQKELLQTERLAAIGQLSAEVVHEIRNPLNSISLNIDWLENELQSSNSEVSKTIRSISREIQRLNQITESYLVRARVPLNDENRTPVNELLREILDFSKEEDKARNINVETTLTVHEFFVRTDRSRLKQAFLNVLKNAKEAMPRGGRLLVKTEIKENVCKVEIADSGYGMNESTRNHTFRPFFTTKRGGTGLGLLLTKDIVEEAQGSICCESQLGVGTKFTMQFPV